MSRKKLTFKEVKKYFEDHDCELLETEYINANTLMKYRCNCGNDKCKITLGNFKNEHRCKKCSILKMTHTFKYVKQYFEDHDCELFEKEYINSMTKMRYRCSCGNDKAKITFTNFRAGHRCKKCGIKKVIEKTKFTFKEVKRYFEEHDCELLETEYIDCKTLMKYGCDCGNDECKITFGDFKTGRRCNECGIIRAANKNRLTYKEVYNYFKKHDCELLETEYINSSTKMRYRCSCGNEKCKIRFNSFRRGTRCKECLIKRISGKNSCNWIEDREEFNEKKKFRKKCRSILTSALKRTGQKKIDRTYKMLGYTAEELRQHIYVHPNWEKVRNKEWHLDHYHPIKAFLDYGIRDIKLINCLENLQPLTDMDNWRKSGKYDEKKFEEWLIGKGYEIICE